MCRIFYQTFPGICQLLEPANIDLSCYREGLKIDCNDELIYGTTVQLRCKNLFRVQKEVNYREKIDCNDELIYGTTVQLRCKNLFRVQKEVNYREIRCQKDGEWDKKLFKCVPGIEACIHRGEGLHSSRFVVFPNSSKRV